MSQPATITDNSIPALAPTFRLQWEEVQNCYVVLYPEGMVKLSNSAGEIMKHCDGTGNVKNILERLQAQYPKANLKQDVYQFLEEAHAQGWIITK